MSSSDEFDTELAAEAEGSESDAEVVHTPHRAAVAGPRQSLFGRAGGFVRGSWHELQRVQWPDRRQVAQATGVVLGFVVVAGCFLGVADLVASKLMNLILK